MRIKLDLKRCGDDEYEFEYCTDVKRIFAYKRIRHEVSSCNLDEFIADKWFDTKKNEPIRNNKRYIDDLLYKIEGWRSINATVEPESELLDCDGICLKCRCTYCDYDDCMDGGCKYSDCDDCIKGVDLIEIVRLQNR